jgi:hypothetical protein
MSLSRQLVNCNWNKYIILASSPQNQNMTEYSRLSGKIDTNGKSNGTNGYL